MSNSIFMRLMGMISLAVTLSTSAASVTVFAAASLTDSLKEIAAIYQKQSGDKIVLNLGASGLLARQIEEGAPADIFFSADESQADALEKKDLLVKETRSNLLGNALVAVVTTDNSNSITAAADLASPKIKRVALGVPKIVPAGAYAKSYFEKLNLWPAIEPKAIPCENVRAVLAAVESGNVDAAMVYQTDAAISKKVKLAFAVPPDDGPRITYPIALVKEAPSPDAARKFLAWLKSDTAAGVFRRAGFLVLESAKTP